MDEEKWQWFQSQNEITKQKLAKKQAKASHSKQRLLSFLRNVAVHSRPFASVDEIESNLKTMKDDEKQKEMLHNKFLFRKLICKHDC